MRRAIICALALSALAAATMSPGAGAAAGAEAAYVVVYAQGASAKQARAAVERAGGKVVRENRAIGVATVTSANASFVLDASRAAAIYGAARNRPIGYATPQLRRKAITVEDELGLAAPAPRAAAQAAVTGDPLAGLQWDMQMIHATPEGSYAVNQGSKDVLVGVIDTGVDGSHPDIAPNLNAALSRNFTTDIPEVDGPCEDETDAPTADPCKDPPNTDPFGHGNHVASIIGSPLNGLGMSGVAPNVTLVDLRVAQDSGYIFLQSTLDAMTYAGDIGVDVANMSFYTDPWLYNCANNPADSPAEQLEQRTVIKATQRAINYGTRKGVTWVNSAGNSDDDLGNPEPDDSSPDFPPGSERHRDIDNSCFSVPAEISGVIVVSAVGPTGRKAYYSNYGLEQVEVSAPGGDAREFFGTPQHLAQSNRVLAAYSEATARDQNLINAAGEPVHPSIVRDCAGGVCGYYRWLQGTSMAAPHATGVAALIVSQFGHTDPTRGGLTMLPRDVRKLLLIRATDHACPRPRLFHYDDPALVPEVYDAYCEGGTKLNGFYGQGIVDALRSLSLP